MGGEKLKLENNKKILKIQSPRDFVGGPYVVVFKSLEERYAIVAMDWDEEPRLGMRWFWGNTGNPVSTGHPTWFVIPPSLSKGIVSSLPLVHGLSAKVDEFLAGKITGTALAAFVRTMK